MAPSYSWRGRHEVRSGRRLRRVRLRKAPPAKISEIYTFGLDHRLRPGPHLPSGSSLLHIQEVQKRSGTYTTNDTFFAKTDLPR